MSRYSQEQLSQLKERIRVLEESMARDKHATPQRRLAYRQELERVKLEWAKLDFVVNDHAPPPLTLAAVNRRNAAFWKKEGTIQ